MTGIAKGLVLAGLHSALILSIGAKLQWDRNSLPRVWTKTAPQDPSTPLRGRYVQLLLEVRPDFDPQGRQDRSHCRLSVSQNELVCHADPKGLHTLRWPMQPDGAYQLTKPVAFFIPEHVPDPSIRPNGEELWVEVSVPSLGAPRPIRLGVKTDGRITPLTLN